MAAVGAELQAVIAIAEQAGRHLMARFRTGLAGRPKGRHSFVCEADESAERLVRAALAERFPGEPVLGEEFGLAGRPARAWWAVDPLDGTTNFLGGLPLFCVSLARIVEGQAVLGAIHQPASGETWAAARGGGAWLGGRRLRIEQTDLGARAIVGITHGLVRRAPAGAVRALGTDKLRCLGSVALELAYAACSRLQAVATRHVHLWDVAAGALLVEEAGGLVRTLEGRPLFPLAGGPEQWLERRLGLLAGAPAMVERLGAALGR
ncbi:MAG: inositol monophosphatase [Planctomycetota bacterium]|nr:MAG: inositol monophosphatase [Planctomycetota bacterium]